MQTGTRNRHQIKVSAYLSYLIPRATRILVILVFSPCLFLFFTAKLFDFGFLKNAKKV